MRFLYHALKGAFTRKPLDPRLLIHGNGVVFKTRAGILDIDANLHLNNASLIYATELARWNLLSQTKLFSHCLKNKWQFMIGSQAVRYRYEIGAFQKFEVVTSIVAIDELICRMQHL